MSIFFYILTIIVILLALFIYIKDRQLTYEEFELPSISTQDLEYVGVKLQELKEEVATFTNDNFDNAKEKLQVLKDGAMTISKNGYNNYFMDFVYSYIKNSTNKE